MVKAKPDLFHAFVGTGQVGDPAKNYAVAYVELLKKAEALKEPHAIRELREVGPPPYSDGRGYGVQRKWSNLFEGADYFHCGVYRPEFDCRMRNINRPFCAVCQQVIVKKLTPFLPS